MKRALLGCALVLLALGCARATRESVVFRGIGLPKNVQVVAVRMGRQGFNSWTLRFPAAFPIADQIKWPKGYVQDPNVLTDDGGDCSTAGVAVAVGCINRPLADLIRIGNSGCTISLDQLVQPAMLSDQMPVEFAQLIIDC